MSWLVRVVLVSILFSCGFSVVCSSTLPTQYSPNGVSAQYLTYPAGVNLTSPDGNWAVAQITFLREVDVSGAVAAEVRDLKDVYLPWQLLSDDNVTNIDVLLAASLPVSVADRVFPLFYVDFRFQTFLYRQNDSEVFANETVSTSPGQLKWRLSVDGWQFRTEYNKLQFGMQLISKAQTNGTRPTPLPSSTGAAGGSSTGSGAGSSTGVGPSFNTSSTGSSGPNSTIFSSTGAGGSTGSHASSTGSRVSSTGSGFGSSTGSGGGNGTTGSGGGNGTTGSGGGSSTGVGPSFNTSTGSSGPTSSPVTPNGYTVVNVPGTESSIAIIFADNSANLIIPTVAFVNEVEVNNIAVKIAPISSSSLSVVWEFPAFTTSYGESVVYEGVLAVTDLLDISNGPTTSNPTTPPPYNSTSFSVRSGAQANGVSITAIGLSIMLALWAMN